MTQTLSEADYSTAERSSLPRMLVGGLVGALLMLVLTGLVGWIRAGTEGAISAAIGAAMAVIVLGIGIAALRAVLDAPGAPTLAGMIGTTVLQVALAGAAFYALVGVTALDLLWIGLSFAATGLAFQLGAVLAHQPLTD